MKQILFDLCVIESYLNNVKNIDIKDLTFIFKRINEINQDYDLNSFSTETLNTIRNICVKTSKEYKNKLQNIANDIDKILNDRPKDNYDNMSKEELIALLRNK